MGGIHMKYIQMCWFIHMESLAKRLKVLISLLLVFKMILEEQAILDVQSGKITITEFEDRMGITGYMNECYWHYGGRIDPFCKHCERANPPSIDYEEMHKMADKAMKWLDKHMRPAS